MAQDNSKIYIGNIVTAENKEDRLINREALVIKDDKIVARGEPERILSQYDGELIRLTDNQILAPGYVDAHLHAPQFKMNGMFLDRPLLDWLQKYTFPTERRFADVTYAEKVYPHVIGSTLRNGTTTAAYFDTIYTDSSLVLAKEAEKQGQRAFIGKVNMDINGLDPLYKEASMQESYDETRRLISAMADMKMVEPIITPRFALTCSISLMKALGTLAKDHKLAVQTHVNENKAEIDFIAENAPYSKFKNYCDVYEECGLFGPRCLMAHSVHTTEAEYRRMAATGTSVVHCPDSNFQLMSGYFDAAFTDQMNVNVSLGTDVGASGLLSISDQICMAERVSKCRAINANQTSSYVTFRQAYDWATMGGARALGMADQIGSLRPGKQFDALLIDTSSFPSYVVEDETSEQIFERWVRTGSKENIAQVFVAGQSRL